MEATLLRNVGSYPLHCAISEEMTNFITAAKRTPTPTRYSCPFLIWPASGFRKSRITLYKCFPAYSYNYRRAKDSRTRGINSLLPTASLQTCEPETVICTSKVCSQRQHTTLHKLRREHAQLSARHLGLNMHRRRTSPPHVMA